MKTTRPSLTLSAAAKDRRRLAASLSGALLVGALLIAAPGLVTADDGDQPCIAKGYEPGDIYGPGPLDVIPDLPTCPDEIVPEASGGPPAVEQVTVKVPKVRAAIVRPTSKVRGL